MSETLSLPEPLVRRMADACEELALTEQDFVTLAVAEKLARLEHQAWLDAQRHEAGASQSAEDPTAQ